MNQRAFINWDRPMLERFKLAYARALKKYRSDNIDHFNFEGNSFVISYAKYLIEFLEHKLGR